MKILGLNLGSASGTDLSLNSLTITGATNSTSVSTGSIVTAGGIGIAQDVFIGGLLNVATTLAVASGAVSATNIVAIRKDQNTSTRLQITNGSAGASASARLQITSADDFFITCTGSGNSSLVQIASGSNFSGGMTLESGAGGLILQADGANSVITKANATTVSTATSTSLAVAVTLTRTNSYYSVKAFTATGNITSATLVTFSNQTGLSFTPPATANYRISAQMTFASTAGGALQNAIAAIRATTGSPTYLVYGDAYFITITTNSYIPAYAYVDVTLTGGVAYVFQVQGQIDAGTLNMDNSHTANGTYIAAFQIN